ncbi:unnamed protein product [Cyclocybe aegerita]|uniref:Uncharacterized protein n=1 Tax=Cyclocybe aegerita TaxID=1973307 RepID=A0A8S0WJ79_CYCAE|nr:unnamed protein product [Cyclocybe aegerita]
MSNASGTYPHELFYSDWMDCLMKSNAGALREHIAEHYARQYGSLEAAAEPVTRFYQILGFLGRQPSGNEDTLLLNINDRYALRLWKGDLDNLMLYSFSFYDRQQRKAVNTPQDYTIHINEFNELDADPGIELRSLEASFRVQDCPAGLESYMVQEGTCISVWKGGERVSNLQIPVRMRPAQPPFTHPQPFGTLVQVPIVHF